MQICLLILCLYIKIQSGQWHQFPIPILFLIPTERNAQGSRGIACLICRSQNANSDDVWPVCGSCQQHPKDHHFEYDDGPGNSRTRALEDTVFRLGAHLGEYENPNETPSMTLNSPYAFTLFPELHLSVPSIPSPNGEPLSNQASFSSSFASLFPLSTPSPPSGSSLLDAGRQAPNASPHVPKSSFLCEIPGCGATITTIQNLQHHLWAHYNYKPYKCTACNDSRFPNRPLSFLTRSDFQRHQRTKKHMLQLKKKEM
ncbi:hypothetical protein L218DRAFT_958307 [Marasmius fiardii PR-910]|nr:hypothetical protein L218DRAFT_958307 [Marasmius fiardii PR-910]